jgi:hypothetical protein
VAVVPQTDWSGQSHGWRYLAQRVDGLGGTGVFLDNELPLQGVTISDVLSGPPQLKGTIQPAYARLKGSDGKPILTPWKTVIHAEADGVIRGSWLLANSQQQGPALSLDGSGFTSYLTGMAYPLDESFTYEEVLDVVRHAWLVIQAELGSNLGLQLDQATTTGVTVGVPTTGTSTTSKGPYQLNWYTTHDLGAEINKLAATTPFDYHERHAWNADKSDVQHFLDFGYPSLGRRRSDLRFVLGENIQTVPNPVDNGTDYANHVVVLGAGTGSVTVRGEARVYDGGLRRMQTINDSSITDSNAAKAAARLELQRRLQLEQLSTIAIRNTPMAQLGSFGVGDEIRVQAEVDWTVIDMWARITQLDLTPDNPDIMVAHLVRSDWVL